MNEMILAISSLLIFLTYISIIVYKYGIRKSISDSYYSLPKKWKLVFLFFIWGFTIPLGIITNAEYPLLLLAIVLISLVGISPNFKEYKQINWLHLTGAIGGIILTIASIIFEFQFLIIGLLLSISIITIYKFIKKPIWWIEILTFLTTWGIIYFKFIL